MESLCNAMQEAASSVFSKMCGINIELESQGEGYAHDRFELSGIVAISGPLKATAVIRVCGELAFAVAEAFLGEKPEEIDAGVIDLIGELANMIGGNAKERMREPGLTLGLPTVITGVGHCVAFPHDKDLRFLRSSSDAGDWQLELGCSPVRTPAALATSATA